MRHPLTFAEFEQLLAGAKRDLFRFERQPAYAVSNEDRLLADFRAGRPLEPAGSSGMLAWLEQVRQQTRRGLYVDRVRIIDNPPTEYQRYLQATDRWNRAAGETIHYLPRWAITRGTSTGGLHNPPFGDADWWLVDARTALIMDFDAGGRLTAIAKDTDPYAIVDAIQFAWRAQRTAEALARQERTPRAA